MTLRKGIKSLFSVYLCKHAIYNRVFVITRAFKKCQLYEKKKKVVNVELNDINSSLTLLSEQKVFIYYYIVYSSICVDHTLLFLYRSNSTISLI